MSEEVKFTTTRIWKNTLRLLRHLHAHTGKSQVRILNELVVDEVKRQGLQDVLRQRGKGE